MNLFINYRMPVAIFLLTVAVLGIRSHAWMDHFCCKNTECMHVENSLLFETRRVMGLLNMPTKLRMYITYRACVRNLDLP